MRKLCDQLVRHPSLAQKDWQSGMDGYVPVEMWIWDFNCEAACPGQDGEICGVTWRNSDGTLPSIL